MYVIVKSEWPILSILVSIGLSQDQDNGIALFQKIIFLSITVVFLFLHHFIYYTCM